MNYSIFMFLCISCGYNIVLRNSCESYILYTNIKYITRIVVIVLHILQFSFFMHHIFTEIHIWIVKKKVESNTLWRHIVFQAEAELHCWNDTLCSHILFSICIDSEAFLFRPQPTVSKLKYYSISLINKTTDLRCQVQMQVNKICVQTHHFTFMGRG